MRAVGELESLDVFVCTARNSVSTDTGFVPTEAGSACTRLSIGDGERAERLVGQIGNQIISLATHGFPSSLECAPVAG
jgi:hypothetical protein